MNDRINPYLEMWGNERDWDRVEIVTLAHTPTSPYLTLCLRKVFFLKQQKPTQKRTPAWEIMLISIRELTDLVKVRLGFPTFRDFITSWWTIVVLIEDNLSMTLINYCPFLMKKSFIWLFRLLIVRFISVCTTKTVSTRAKHVTCPDLRQNLRVCPKTYAISRNTRSM